MQLSSDGSSTPRPTAPVEPGGTAESEKHVSDPAMGLELAVEYTREGKRAVRPSGWRESRAV